MKFNRYIIAILTVAMVWGCTEDIIEVENESAVEPSVALARVSGINSLVISAYKRLNEFNYYGQSQILNAEALADNLVIANNTGRYTGQVVNGVGSHFGTWSTAPYRIINDCNLILKYVDASTPSIGSNEPRAVLERARYKGEAHFLRALAYHDLVKVYGYEPVREVNGWTEGAIIRTEAVETVAQADKRSRSTNQEVYDLIVADLIAAIDLLPEENRFITAPTAADAPFVFAPGDRYLRASKQAARALLARVYLYLEDWPNANLMATSVLSAHAVYPNTGGGTLRTVVASGSYVGSFAQTIHPESIFEISISSADWSTVDGVNNSLASITNSTPTGGAAGIFSVAGSPELYAAYEATDVRRNLWVNNSGRWECKKWMGEKGTFLENVQFLRVSEVVLIAAEARANLNLIADAQTAINSLRTNRGLAATTESDQAALLALIYNERRVELAFEGHRFFDLKRREQDIIKPASLGINNVPYTDYRILAPLPNAEVTYNPSLEQNPNY